MIEMHKNVIRCLKEHRLRYVNKDITRAMLVAKQRVGLPFDLSSDYSIR